MNNAYSLSLSFSCSLCRFHFSFPPKTLRPTKARDNSPALGDIKSSVRDNRADRGEPPPIRSSAPGRPEFLIPPPWRDENKFTLRRKWCVICLWPMTPNLPDGERELYPGDSDIHPTWKKPPRQLTALVRGRRRHPARRSDDNRGQQSLSRTHLGFPQRANCKIAGRRRRVKAHSRIGIARSPNEYPYYQFVRAAADDGRTRPPTVAVESRVKSRATADLASPARDRESTCLHFRNYQVGRLYN